MKSPFQTFDDQYQAIQEYRESPNVNQSYLKALIQNKKYKEIEDPEQRFLKGNLVDGIITLEDETLGKLFYVSRIDKKPEDKYKKPIDNLIASNIIGNFDDMLPAIIDEFFVVNSLNWGRNVVQSKLEDPNNFCKDYWEDKIMSEGKTVVSQEEFNKGESLAGALISSPEFQKINRSKNIVLYQLPVYFEYVYISSINGETQRVACKMLLDMVEIDFDAETIQPIDIKQTDAPKENFASIGRSLGYPIQGFFYSYGLRSALTEDFANFKILPFKFIAVSDAEGTPEVFEYTMSKYDMFLAQYGIEYTYGTVAPRNQAEEELFTNTLMTDKPFKHPTFKRTILGVNHAMDIHLFGKPFNNIGFHDHVD